MHFVDTGSSKAAVAKTERPLPFVSRAHNAITCYPLTAWAAQMYPTNPQATPGLSPPTPNEISPVDPSYPSSSFSNTSVPLHRQSSAQSQTQFIVTPDELAAAQQQAQAAAPLDEPLAIDPALSSHGADNADGYFEGVVGLKQDGTAVIDHNPGSSPYARYPSSPPNSQIHHHPYRRPQAVTSPIRGSPTALFSTGVKSYTPSNFNGDSRPVFAMPFPPQNHTYAMQHHEGLLAPPLEQAVKMEKQTSAESDPTTWQRW